MATLLEHKRVLDNADNLDLCTKDILNRRDISQCDDVIYVIQVEACAFLHPHPALCQNPLYIAVIPESSDTVLATNTGMDSID